LVAALAKPVALTRGRKRRKGFTTDIVGLGRRRRLHRGVNRREARDSGHPGQGLVGQHHPRRLVFFCCAGRLLRCRVWAEEIPPTAHHSSRSRRKTPAS